MTTTLRLHDYQLEARDFLLSRPGGRGGLFLDMGLGKTAIALSALTPEHLPALVVAPKRVAETVWPVEAQRWRPDLSVAVAAGSPANRARALVAEKDLIVVGRDNLKDVDPAARETPFRTLILDELSGFKNRTSNRWQLARNLIAYIPHVWGLTGTPMPNGLMDLWAPTYLIDRGARLGKNITAFRTRYFTPGLRLPNGIITEWLPRPEADKNIRELLADLYLAMGTEGRIRLPEVTYNEVRISLPPPIRTVYRRLKNDLLVDLRDVLGDGPVHSAFNAAVLTNRLSQVAAGFLYPDAAAAPGATPDILHREKVNAVLEVVEGTGSPVLVFYRYQAERDLLREAIPGAVLLEEQGAIARWNDGQVPVLLAHPASAGHGLNLQHGGHTIVWTSLPWSLEEWQQGNKRLHRQGQLHPVVIHMLIAEKTVDEAIRARLTDKASVQDALLRHLESPL